MCLLVGGVLGGCGESPAQHGNLRAGMHGPDARKCVCRGAGGGGGARFAANATGDASLFGDEMQNPLFLRRPCADTLVRTPLGAPRGHFRNPGAGLFFPTQDPVTPHWGLCDEVADTPPTSATTPTGDPTAA